MTRIQLSWLLLFAVAGCADAGKGYPVTGTVTLDGVPIAEGSITFRPVDARQRPESAEIENGEFSLKLPPGKSRVEVNASRPSSAPPVVGMGPSMEDYIPDKYRPASARVDIGVVAPTDWNFVVDGRREGSRGLLLTVRQYLLAPRASI